MCIILFRPSGIGINCLNCRILRKFVFSEYLCVMPCSSIISLMKVIPFSCHSLQKILSPRYSFVKPQALISRMATPLCLFDSV